MFYKWAKVLLAAIILTNFFAIQIAHAQTRTLEEIVAWVNSDVILKSEYEKRKAELRDELARPQAQGGPGLQGAQLEQAFNQQSKTVIQELIDETLFVQQAKDMGITAESEIIKTMDQLRQQRKLDSLEALYKEIETQGYSLDDFRNNIKVKYLREEVLRREVYGRVIITNEEVRKYYDAHIKEFDRPAGIWLREITFLTENRGPELVAGQKKKAEDALAAVKKGDDFAETASKVSESETSQNGGDIGFFAKGELTPALEAIVDKLDKGQVTDVIPTQGAFMIFKVEDKHPGGILPFELAQKKVFDVLWQQAVPGKMREYLTKLRTEGFVRTADGYDDTGAPDKADKSVSKN
jgi:peptidyl-prolyl cis-trans isomerase SurA